LFIFAKNQRLAAFFSNLRGGPCNDLQKPALHFPRAILISHFRATPGIFPHPVVHLRNLGWFATAWLEARLVSGHALQACRQEQLEGAGFSRCAVTSKVQRLKPFKVVAFGGIAEAMP
jgi:hypothetical protein